MIKYKFILLLAFFLVYKTNISSANDDIINQQRFIKILPVYQSLSTGNDATIWEFGFPIYAYIPYGRNLSVSLRTSQATVQGDSVQKLNGLTDTQLSFNYYHPSLHTVFNLGMNLPSGKNELNSKELRTSMILSMDQFDFLVPNFGQGLNISPGFSWALSLNDYLAMGLGAAYQYKGEYRPMKENSEDYNPGDEFIFTGGLDARLSSAATLSADVIYTTYFADKRGKREVFNSGNRMVISAQFRHYFGHNELRVFTRYRARTKSEYALIDNRIKNNTTSPSQFQLFSAYHFRFNQGYSLGLSLEGNFYGSTTHSNAMQLFGLAIESQIPVTENVKMPIRLKYSAGNDNTGLYFNCFEFGLGVLILF